MKAQDLKKQLLNVVGPVDFSQTPLELLQKFADAETDETLRRYFCKTKQKTTAPTPTA